MSEADALENNDNRNNEIDDNDDEEDQDIHINKPSPHAFESYKFLSNLVQEIYHYCVCVQQTVREYASLDEGDQRQVWDDLVGKEGRRRVFVQGHELITFVLKYEPPSMVQDAL